MWLLVLLSQKYIISKTVHEYSWLRFVLLYTIGVCVSVWTDAVSKEWETVFTSLGWVLVKDLHLGTQLVWPWVRTSDEYSSTDDKDVWTCVYGWCMTSCVLRSRFFSDTKDVNTNRAGTQNYSEHTHTHTLYIYFSHILSYGTHKTFYILEQLKILYNYLTFPNILSIA